MVALAFNLIALEPENCGVLCIQQAKISITFSEHGAHFGLLGTENPFTEIADNFLSL